VICQVLPKPKAMTQKTKYHTCPQCGSAWNEYEQGEQECFTCGHQVPQMPAGQSGDLPADQEPGAAQMGQESHKVGTWPQDMGRGLPTLHPLKPKHT